MANAKTFANDEILTAQDVNTHLNPSTADHIPYAMAAGEVTVPVAGDPRQGNKDVTFPPGRFTVPPVVTTSVNHAYYSHSSNNVSTVGFNAYVDTSRNSTISSTVVRWTAVQMTPNSAEG